MGELACRLARESVFGEEMMVKCTVHGFRHGKALPPEGIAAIQEAIIQYRFPLLTIDSTGFMAIWKTCAGALNHACSKIRCKHRQYDD